VLFVGAAIGKISVTDALKSIWPFYMASLIVLILVVYVPALSLWLPAVLR
jgi:TRAP-type C4-dicarboxylate transport system permease large subunit